MPSGGRGGAPRATAHCARPVPPPLPDTAGGAALPLLRCLGRAALHTSPHTAALRRALQLLSRASWPQRGSTPFRRAALRCAVRAVGTEQPSPSGTALRPAPLRPSRGTALRREGGQHPSQWKRAARLGQHLARRAGAAAPSPAIPGVRRPGAAASSHRRRPAPGSRLVSWSWRGRKNPKPGEFCAPLLFLRVFPCPVTSSLPGPHLPMPFPAPCVPQRGAALPGGTALAFPGPAGKGGAEGRGREVEKNPNPLHGLIPRR